MRIEITNDEQLRKHFEGILIRVTDPPPLDLSYNVPGWKCKTCGWQVGSSGYPPSHECPDEGNQQQCSHEWEEDTPYEEALTDKEIVYRECPKCGKREYKFAKDPWWDQRKK